MQVSVNMTISLLEIIEGEEFLETDRRPRINFNFLDIARLGQ